MLPWCRVSLLIWFLTLGVVSPGWRWLSVSMYPDGPFRVIVCLLCFLDMNPFFLFVTVRGDYFLSSVQDEVCLLAFQSCLKCSFVLSSSARHSHFLLCGTSENWLRTSQKYQIVVWDKWKLHINLIWGQPLMYYVTRLYRVFVHWTSLGQLGMSCPGMSCPVFQGQWCWKVSVGADSCWKSCTLRQTCSYQFVSRNTTKIFSS